MTNRNIKMTLIVALAAAALIPVAGIVNAETSLDDGVTIKYEKHSYGNSPNLERLTELEEQKMNAVSDEERTRIQLDQVRIISEEKIANPLDQERIDLGTVVTSHLTTKLTQYNSSFERSDNNYIPFTGIGYYPNDDAIIVGIHEDSVNPGNMQKYAKIIRDYIGTEFDLILHKDVYVNLDACANRDDDCVPMEGGIQIDIDGFGCTLGLPATRGTVDGFITAGHCADGETDEDVGQALLSSRVVGTVDIEVYDSGSSNETCDCAFIETDSGPTTVDQEIFGISSSYYPDHTDSAGVNDYIKHSGAFSGVKTGQVVAVNVTKVDINNTTLTGLTQTNYDRQGGDSGSPVMDAFSADPGYLGMHVAGVDGVYPDPDEGYYVLHGKITSDISSLTLGI